MSEYVLFGDGIHDDTAAIQNMIDGSSEVVLPVPAAFYLISKPLVLHSNFKLKLPRFAEIRLADGSDCVMLSGIMKEDTNFAVTLPITVSICELISSVTSLVTCFAISSAKPSA